MNKLSLLLLFGAAALLLSTCQSSDPLPTQTQTGQNKLGCLIDGRTYIPDGGPGFMPIKPVNGGLFGISSNSVGVYIWTYNKDKQRLDFYLGDIKLGPHPLNTTTGTKPAYLYPADYGLYQAPDGTEYVTSQKHTGIVTLTKADTTTGIVSGSFSFVAADPSGQTVTISDGRFDVNARTQ